MRLLNIVTSPRRERSASIAVIDSFLLEYQKRIKGVVVDTLDVWTESLPEFDAEAIGAKYKGVSGEAMTSSERATWEKIRELASRFQKADRIVLGVPMWNFSFPYKLKQLIDLACQRMIAITMIKHDIRVGLNVPVRIYIYEGADGRTRVAYDLPSTLMSGLDGADVAEAARKLDAKLIAVAETISGATV